MANFVAAAIHPNATNRGKKGTVLNLAGPDVVLEPGCKGIMVITAGNLVYRPIGNGDTEYVTITSAPAGFIAPHIPNLVRNTTNGTTATVCTIED